MNQFFIVFVGIVFSGQAAAQFFAYTTSKLLHFTTILFFSSKNIAAESVKGITNAHIAGNHILWLRSLKPHIQAHDDTPNPDLDKKPHGDGLLELENVEFAYPQRPDARVLRGINVTVSLYFPH